MGAMVYGGTKRDKISLNHDNIWSGTAQKYKREHPYVAYEKAKQLVIDGDIEKAESTIEEDFGADWIQTFQPMSELYIETKTKDAVYYNRRLDLTTATVNVKYETDENIYKRKYFMSYSDDALIIKYESEKQADYVIEIGS